MFPALEAARMVSPQRSLNCPGHTVRSRRAMTDGRPYASESGKVRRLVAWELVRALLTTVVVVALFYLLPLDTWSSVR